MTVSTGMSREKSDELMQSSSQSLRKEKGARDATTATARLVEGQAVEGVPVVSLYFAVTTTASKYWRRLS